MIDDLNNKFSLFFSCTGGVIHTCNEVTEDITFLTHSSPLETAIGLHFLWHFIRIAYNISTYQILNFAWVRYSGKITIWGTICGREWLNITQIFIILFSFYPISCKTCLKIWSMQMKLHQILGQVSLSRVRSLKWDNSLGP